MNCKRYCIIVAGGQGQRMGGELPKQFMLLGKMPILMHTLAAFYAAQPDCPLIVMLPAATHSHWNALCREHNFTLPHQLLAGGTERFHSVKIGLNHIFKTEKDLSNLYVAIHDGVRPLVEATLIQNAFRAAEIHKAVIPVIPSADSIRLLEDTGSRPYPRENVIRVQTPQIFSALILKDAFSQAYSPAFTDDASVVERAGYPVYTVPGCRQNIKITFPEDLALAHYWLNR